MCGICGFIGNKESKEKKEAILRSMMDAMRHRGPDSDGIFVSDEAALGFCRLSIIDLEDGNQPMHNEDDNLTLVFNGEIYNFKELREELTAKGHRFANHSDSETLLHGYESYHTDLVNKIRGMFAFAIWNEQEKSLFAARDFFGIKPFFYTTVDGCFVFASELKSLLQYPGFVKEVDEMVLEEYLTFQYSPLERTFFKGVYRLMPGHYLTYQNGGLKIERYFDPMLTPKKRFGSDKQIISQIDKVMSQSVERHMVSDVEVGAFLSGGVDSSYIATKFTGDKAFTVGFFNEKNHYSEIGYAKELAEKLGLEHHVKIISKEEYWDTVPKAIYHLDEPSGDASAIALYFVAQEAAKYVKVVTSGEGSDELFGGYNIYLEPKALRWVNWMPKKVRKTIGALAEKMPDIKGRNYLIRCSKDVEERYAGNAHIFSDEERRELMKKDSGALSTEELLRPCYKKVEKLNDMNKMQYLDLNYWLPGDILQKADKMSMAHSLELRVPFLDRDVFELARNLPTGAKVRNHQTKYLFRKATESSLPHESSDRRKLGFPVPIRVWINEEPWYSEIMQAFSGESANKFFHTGKLRKLLEEHKKGQKDNSRKIWTVFVFLVWYRVFFEEAA